MDFETIMKEQMEQVLQSEDANALSEYAASLSNGISDQFTMENILNATLEGKSIFQSPELINSLKQLFLYEIKSAMVIGIEILTICIVIGLLKNLSGSFGSKSIEEIANMTCMMVIVGLALVHFEDVYTMAFSAVKTIAYTMELLLPVLIGVLISMGQITSGTIMSPLLLTIITLFQWIIKNFILPAIFISAVFVLLNCLTEKDYVNQLSKTIRQTALFVMGLLMTVMTGIISVQGLITKTSDGLIMGTAKYSLDTFIPIVGGFTADTIELFLKCMGSIKNIIGIFGILLILSMILSPIIKIGAIAIIYKLIAVFVEPVASKKIAAGISDIGSVLVTLGAVLFFSSLMFIIFITSIMSIGGSG